MGRSEALTLVRTAGANRGPCVRGWASSVGRRLFYRSNPKIVSRAGLVVACRAKRAVEVHGCVTPHGEIFIARVSHENLQGLIVVAAAHEMLHVAYRRLTDEDRQAVDNALWRDASSGDPELIRTLAKYAPARRSDERYAFVGTEHAALSNELERLYRRYFDDRQRVVRACRGFTSLIEKLERQIARLAARLTRLRDEAEARRAAGDIDGYNELVDPHNDAVREHTQKVRQYNELVSSLERD